MDIFTVAHARNRRDVITRQVGNVFQYHWFQVSVVSFDKELFLKFHDGHHGREQGLLTLLDGIDKPAGRVDFLLYKHHCIFHLAALILFAGSIILKHIVVGAVDTQLGNIAVVERHAELTFVVFQNKVGHNGSHRFFQNIAAPGIAGFGVEVSDFGHYLFQHRIVHVQSALNFIVMLARKLFEIVFDYSYGQFDCIAAVFSFQLQFQAFL